MALEIIKRLLTILAAIERFAGSAAEFADQGGIVGITPGTGDRFFPPEETRMTYQRYGRRRCNAKSLELVLPLFAHPVRGPGRRQYGRDLYRCITPLQ